MRIEIFPVHHSHDGSYTRFSINCWYVGVFPLTFTLQDCAEAFCDLVGWEFVSIYEEVFTGCFSMRVEIPANDPSSTETIQYNYCHAAGLVAS